MDTLINTLKRYYDSAMKRQDAWYFFQSLADYVAYIKRTPETREVVDRFTNQKEALLKVVQEYENRAQSELQKTRKEILKIIKNNNVSGPRLDEILRDLDWYLKGKIHMSGVSSDHLESYLFDICVALNAVGHGKLVEKFINPDRKP